MKKSDVQNLPKSIRRSYNLTNGVRTATMMLGWVLTVVLFIYALKTGPMTFSNIVFAPIFGAGFIHGAFHAEFLYKKAFNKLGLIIGFFASMLIFMIAAYAGFIFLITDTVLFILKKPLIYPFEDKNFLLVKDLSKLIAEEGGVAYEYDIPEELLYGESDD